MQSPTTLRTDFSLLQEADAVTDGATVAETTELEICAELTATDDALTTDVVTTVAEPVLTATLVDTTPLDTGTVEPHAAAGVMTVQMTVPLPGWWW